MRREKPIEVLTEDEVQRLLRAANPRSTSGCRNRALVALAAYGGLRVGELLALKVKDVNLGLGEIHVLRGKGAIRRTAALLPGGELPVARWLERRASLGLGAAPLFCTISKGQNTLTGRMRPGQALSRPYVHRMPQRLATRAGIEKRVHPHGLRHTHAALVVLRGNSMPDLRDQLGHGSLATTSSYVDSFAPVDRIARLRA